MSHDPSRIAQGPITTDPGTTGPITEAPETETPETKALVTEETQARGSRTLVLVHGLGVSSWYFEPLLEVIGDEMPTLLLDLPGFGEAEVPDMTLWIGGLAESLVRTLREKSLDDVVLVGHSMGAQVVVEAITRYPGIAKAAVLLTPVVPPEDRHPRQVIKRFAQASLHEPPGAAYRSVLTFLTTDPTWIARHFRAMTAYPLEDRIAELPASLPLLLLRGSNDRISSRAFLKLLQERARAGHENRRVVIREVQGASHHVMGTHARAVAATIVPFALEA